MSKREQEEAKRAEAARKKAERDALLEEETKDLPSKPTKSKTAAKKTSSGGGGGGRGIDAALSDSVSSLNASNIDDALDALTLTNKSVESGLAGIDRHPERRFKAALAAYEETRLPQIREEHKGLRLQQYKEMIFKEFQKSDQNPKNQLTARFDSTRDELREIAENQRKHVEQRLGRS